MTLSTTVNRTRTQGNGITVTFNFPYYFLADGDLTVIYTSATGVETTLVLNTDYTVTGAGIIAGGSVTLIGTYAASPPATGTFITIVRDPAATQETDYVENDSFPAETHEQALDRLTMLVQRLSERVDRGLSVAQSSGYSALTLPDPVGAQYLRWKADVTGLENVSVTPDPAEPIYYGKVMSGNESYSYPGGTYSRCLLDPGGAARTFNPSAGFPSGFLLEVRNSGEEVVVVDSAAAAIAVGPGQTVRCLYNGSGWIAQVSLAYVVNAAAADQGAAGVRSVKALVDSIGSTQATLVFAHTAAVGSTTYTFSTSEDIPDNITVVIEPGAQLAVATGVTVSIGRLAPLPPVQVFACSGTGKVTFTNGLDVYPEWWGAVSTGIAGGGADAATAIQKALSCAGAADVWVRVLFCGTEYRVDSEISVDVYQYSIHSEGTIWRAANNTGTTLTITSSATDAGMMAMVHKKHPVDGLFLVGPGSNESGSIGITFDPAIISAESWICCVVLNNISWSGYETCIKATSGCFQLVVDNPKVCFLSANYDCIIFLSLPTGLTNAGENITVRSGHFANLTSATILSIALSSASVFFENCSLDYCKKLVAMASTGVSNVFFDGCHIEMLDDTDYWFDNETTTSGNICIQNSVLYITGNKASYAIGYSAAVNGGIVLRNTSVWFAGGMTYAPDFLVLGTGRVVADTLAVLRDSLHVAPSAYTNKLPWAGGFESAAALTAFTDLVGGGLTRDNAKAKSGTYSLKIESTSGAAAGISYIVPAEPGKHFAAQLYYQTGDLHDGTLILEANWCDKNGATIAACGAATVTTDNVATWTRLQLSSAGGNPAPAGTHGLYVKAQVYDVTNPNTGTAHIDDFYADVF